MAILWGYPIRARRLPNGRVLRLVRRRRQDVRGILRGVERPLLRVAVDQIILAVLAAFGAISLVALLTWFGVRLVFG